jgi:hypothetical protein
MTLPPGSALLRTVSVLLATVAGGMSLAASAWADDGSVPAAAEFDRVSGDERPLAVKVDAVQFLPGTMAPDTGSGRASGMGWAGYDGAARAPLVSAMVAARLTGRLILAVTASNSSTSSAVRPGVAARLQVLQQGSHGIDGNLSLGYRRDLFSAEGGFFQAVLGAGRRMGATNVIANLAYGQDGEGDDRDGELRVAVLRSLTGRLQLGLDARYGQSLVSTDPNRAAHGTPSMTYIAGAVAAFTVGSWAMLLETGATGRRTQQLENGYLAMAGIGAGF